MSGIRYYLFMPKITASNTGAVKNDGGVPSILSGLDDSKPAAGVVGRLYVATDTKYIYRDNGTTWELLAGNASTVGSYPVWSPGALPPSEITDQIVVMSAEEVQNRVYNFIPLTMKASTPVASSTTSFSPIDCRVRGNYLYLYALTSSSPYTLSLIIVDISNANAPVVVSNTVVSNDMLTLYTRSVIDLQGFYLYFAGNKVFVYDIGDISLPVLAKDFPISYTLKDMKIVGNYLYVAASDYSVPRLLVYDISADPWVKKIDMFLPITPNCDTAYYPDLTVLMNVKGSYVYVACYYNSVPGAYSYTNSIGIAVIDVSNKDYPALVSTSHWSVYYNRGSYPISYIQGNFWYLWNGKVLRIVDISDPTYWSRYWEFEAYNSGLQDCQTYVYYNYAYFGGTSGVNGTLSVVDISDPAHMSVKKSITGLPLHGISLIRVYGNYLYAITKDQKLLIFG